MNQYVVIADAHLGYSKRSGRIDQLATDARTLGYRVVWAGDTFDTLRFKRAARWYGDVVQDADVRLRGNHDYATPEIGCADAYRPAPGVIVTHGDWVDFGYAAQRLAAVTRGEIRGTRTERLLARVRRWHADDLYAFYALLDDLSDRDIAAYHWPRRGWPLLRALPAYARLAWRVVRLPESPMLAWGRHRVSPPLTDRPDGEAYRGYFTTNPQRIAERLLPVLERGGEPAHTLIIGHLHHQIDEVVTYQGRSVRVICLGDWTSDDPKRPRTPTVAFVQGGEVTVMEVGD